MNNSEIMLRHRVGNQGGIRKSNATKSFVLVVNNKVEKYNRDRVGAFEIDYMGAFTRGKQIQEMSRMNKALAETTWDLHVYSRSDGANLVYDYWGVYKRQGEPIKVNNVYMYNLRRVTQEIVYDFDSFEY